MKVVVTNLVVACLLAATVSSNVVVAADAAQEEEQGETVSEFIEDMILDKLGVAEETIVNVDLTSYFASSEEDSEEEDDDDYDMYYDYEDDEDDLLHVDRFEDYQEPFDDDYGFADFGFDEDDFDGFEDEDEDFDYDENEDEEDQDFVEELFQDFEGDNTDEYYTPQELEQLYEQEDFEAAMDPHHRGLKRRECTKCIPKTNKGRWKCNKGLVCKARPKKSNPPVKGCPKTKPQKGVAYCVDPIMDRCDIGCKSTKECRGQLVCRKFTGKQRIPNCGSGKKLGIKPTQKLGVCIRKPTKNPTATPTMTPTSNPTINVASDLRKKTKFKLNRRKEGVMCKHSQQCQPGLVCDAKTNPQKPVCRKSRVNELRFVASQSKFRNGFRTGNGKEVLDSIGNLSHCEGHCGMDWDCAWGHICVRRNGSTPNMKRFGCRGQGIDNQNYCVSTEKFETVNGLLPLTIWRNDGEDKKIGGDGVDPNDPFLDLCEGDCDNDSHCRGNLVCMFRDYADEPSLKPNGKEYHKSRYFPEDAAVSFEWKNEVVGCWGLGENDVDYCVRKQWLGQLQKVAKAAADVANDTV